MNKVYVENQDNLIYEVEVDKRKIYDTHMELQLTLICGYDYINPDDNDSQGYVKENRFVEEVQNETVVCYYWTEGINQCLEDNGYTIRKNLPYIY